MSQVTTNATHTILAASEGPAAEVFNAHGKAPICLVCEHASAFIPAALNNLGVAPEQQKSHAAWDIGGRALATAMSDSLDAPCVASRVSRLVYDCNRPPNAHDAIPAKSEVIDVPGNTRLSEQDKAMRVAEVYHPFREKLMTTLDGFSTPPALVTIHTFTPIWHGTPRAVEMGLLHDSDDALAKAMLVQAPNDLNTQLNAPYSITDGVTHTLQEHAIARGLPNVMIEVRNDLVSDPQGVARMANILTQMLSNALATQEVT